MGPPALDDQLGAERRDEVVSAVLRHARVLVRLPRVFPLVHARKYDRPVDDIDRQLVSRLVRDGREAYADLARAVGLSLSATKRRVDRLVSDGAIRGFTAVVDPEVMGWALSASVELFTTGTVPFERMRRDLDAMPEVVSASTVSGGADAMLRVVASDAGHLERVISRLRGLPYVQQTNTVLLLSSLLSRPTPLTTDGPG
jgi:DNA-binding Lrp family transcriptional regulator